MSTTKTKAATAVEAAAVALAEAEAKHAAILAEASTAEESVGKALTELGRIERCIAVDDPTAGLEDLAKVDTELRYFKLQFQAKNRAATLSGGAVATAKSQRIMAGIEADEYAIHMDKLRPEAEALASKIAALLVEHVASCEAHNAGRSELLSDVQDSDAVNQHGTGNPDSPLSWGFEDGKRHKPLWIEVEGEPVPEIYGPGRWKAIQKRVTWIIESGEATAAEYSPIF